MGVRQYVGARYVPQIIGEWNGQTVYEPLSVVTYNFGSYTSKKAVPAGVAPTNDEYWALTGQYNAQVEEYRQEVEGLKGAVEEVKAEVENMTYKRYYLLVGDSYANPTYNGWATQLVNMMGWTDEDYTISYKGGYAFHGDQLLSLITKLSQATRNKVTDLIIISAGNDMAVGNQGEVESYVRNFFQQVPVALPNYRKVWAGCCPYRRVNTDPVRAYNLVMHMRKYMGHNMKFMTYSPSFCKDNTDILPDGTHLTPSGYEKIAYNIKQVIEGNESAPPASNGYQITPEGAVIETAVENNMLFIKLDGGLTFSDSSATIVVINEKTKTQLRGGNYTYKGVFLYNTSGDFAYGQMTANDGTVRIVSNKQLTGRYNIAFNFSLPCELMC